jgi:SNF2 family DNA or RNA helicase
MIKIEKRGRRIEIRANRPLPGMRTTVPGAYETVAGYWTVPLSIESYILLRHKYGKELQPGNELKRWVNGVQQNRAQMKQLANSKTAELVHLPRVAPKLYKAMRKRKYQLVGTRFIADNPATLVADDPGLGKTLMAMGGILEAEIPGPYLVIAPKTATDTTWNREITKWLPDHYRVVILPEWRGDRERKIRLTRYTKDTWLIIHPEIVLVKSWLICTEKIKKKGKIRICGKRSVEGNAQQRQLSCGHIKTRSTKKLLDMNYPKLFEIEWGAVVVDESQESLIRRKGVKTQRRRGLDMLKVRADGIKLAMSGTPYNSRPHYLWGTLNWLDSYTYSAFYRWAELYWRKGGYTGYEIGEFISERERMLWSSLDAIAIRRTKAEVAKDLPPKMYVGTPLEPKDEHSPTGIWLDMDDKQQRIYEEMERTSIAHLESGDLNALEAIHELTRLKQFACAYGDIEIRNCWQTDKETGKRFYGPKDFFKPSLPSNKYNWIVENLEEWGYPKDPIDKVVIVSFFSEILRMMARGINRHFRVKKDSPLVTGITGRTPAKIRRKVIDEFNQRDSGPQIMFLNVKAGGTSITIDSADRMIFISQTRIPDQQTQAEDRIHRVSNPRHCFYYYLNSLETVDVGTAIANVADDRISHRLLDGRRGLEYTRQILDLSHS